ncbi:MAG TPA: hypothetical protein VF219_17640 [Vicinamibacterales bacterium]
MVEQPQAKLMADADEPLVLVGPPRGIRGEFRLQNPTSDKVIVREPRFLPAAPSGRSKVALASAAIPESQLVMRRIIMRPGQSRPVPVALTLDRRTRPGTYHAQLEINGQQRTVVIHVTEEVSLAIAPEEIVLPHAPGEKIKKRIVFTNDGNTPISVRSLGTVVLDEELVHCRALRGALAEAGDTTESIDDFFVVLARRYKKLYETLVLKVQNTAVTIEPGETEAVDLTITLPEKLEPRSRYSGYAAISTSNLYFTIVPE